uniref:Osteoclast-stimulating factor 1 n=1 Tax=Sphaeramia orbicularis TaxID=375764 RepID=A0A672YBT6_9TELE
TQYINKYLFSLLSFVSSLVDIFILQTSGNWYKAELNGVEGFVPKNFINIDFPSWYQEDASRSDAKKLLISQPTGTFIIRRSRDEDAGSFSISVRNAKDVQHLKVLRDTRGQYYLWTEKFPSVNQLVEFYKKNSVSKQDTIFLLNDGFICLFHQQRRRPDRSPSLPPPTPPNPSRSVSSSFSTSTLQVIAIYNFQAKEKDELEFHAGDIIAVLDSSDQVWWKGQLRGKTGLFPCNYTKPM